MKKFLSLVVMGLVVSLSSVSFGQSNPCPQLFQQVQMAEGQLASYQNLLSQRQNDLAAKQAHLATLQGWYSLFWAGITAQAPEPMSPGQQQTLIEILNAIAAQNSAIAQDQALVNYTQSAVNYWANKRQQAIAAYNAAGC